MVHLQWYTGRVPGALFFVALQVFHPPDSILFAGCLGALCPRTVLQLNADAANQQAMDGQSQELRHVGFCLVDEHRQRRLGRLAAFYSTSLLLYTNL